MNEKPMVYIILVNFNGWKDSLECMESIFHQEYLDFRVVLSDNASTNGSLDHIRDWAKGIITVKADQDRYSASVEPNIRKPLDYKFYTRAEVRAAVSFQDKQKLVLIDNQENAGFAAGNNTAIQYALKSGDADYVWLLNNDTVLAQDTLTAMLKTMSAYPEAGMAGSKLLYYYTPGIIQSMGNNQAGWKTAGMSVLYEQPDRETDDLKVRSIIGASMLVKRGVIEKIGMMDEAYFMQHEETDWCMKALAAGYSIYSSGKSRVYHKEGKSSVRAVARKSMIGRPSNRVNIKSFLILMYYGFRNEIYFVRKNFPDKYLLFLLGIVPFRLLKYILGIFLYNDDHKTVRIKMLFRAVLDGIMGRMGKTVDPRTWFEKWTDRI